MLNEVPFQQVVAPSDGTMYLVSYRLDKVLSDLVRAVVASWVAGDVPATAPNCILGHTESVLLPPSSNHIKRMSVRPPFA